MAVKIKTPTGTVLTVESGSWSGNSFLASILSRRSSQWLEELAERPLEYIPDTDVYLANKAIKLLSAELVSIEPLPDSPDQIDGLVF